MSSETSARHITQVAVDPYRVLGIERQASEAEIKRAYFQLVRQFPPEREPEKFQEIRAAYEALRDPHNRVTLDLFLIQPPAPLPKRRSPCPCKRILRNQPSRTKFTVHGLRTHAKLCR